MMEAVFLLTTAVQMSSLLMTLTQCTVECSADTKQTIWPLHSQKPVLLIWNAPTQECGPRYGVNFSYNQFDIVASPLEGFVRQNLTLFYAERIGLYPFYHEEHAVNGGIPQLASLTQHFAKLPEDLNKYIPNRKTKGLAVIDWEEWRPLWVRNWDLKDIYRNKSCELIARKNPTWTSDRVAKVAQQEFELSGRRFMQETLKLGKSLRPNQLWGYYLFPDCYNHDYDKGLETYTGHCPPVEMNRNDRLDWMWMESTAFFPSVYMPSKLKSTKYGRLFVRYRVNEAMRHSTVGGGLARPVFVYTQPTYNMEMNLLSEQDLVATIGESVAAGAAGLIFWGDSKYSDKSGCSSINTYLKGPLGRYLLNVTTAAEQCSQMLCKFHGRCVRKVPDSDEYLHLSASTHKITRVSGQLKLTGKAGQAELLVFRKHFKCQCYSGYKGEGCEQKEKRQNRAPSVLGNWPLCLLLPLGLLFLLH